MTKTDFFDSDQEIKSQEPRYRIRFSSEIDGQIMICLFVRGEKRDATFCFPLEQMQEILDWIKSVQKCEV